MSYMSQTEVDALAKIGQDIEHMLMWGTADRLALRREHATKLLVALFTWNRVDQEECSTLTSMINSPLEEDLILAETILKVK